MSKTINTPSFQILIENYDRFIAVRNYKVGKSKNLYHNPIKEFLIWIEEAGIRNIQKITSKESVKYYEYLISRPKHTGSGTLSEKTIKFHLFTLGLFLTSLLENKEINESFYIPGYADHGIKKHRNALSVDEIKMLYKYCENHQESALLSVGYGCGLRNAEIEALDVKDVQFATGMLVVRKGKNGKRRDVPMSDAVIEHLKKYVEERYKILPSNKALQEALFVTSSGKRMDGEQMNDMLKKMSEQTNSFELIQKQITLHCLRHTIAHHLAQNNAGIEFIRGFLGHSQINTTYIYAIRNKKSKPITTF